MDTSAEDDHVRSPENLVDLYFQSVGRGASLLLNLPPDRRGLIHERDTAALAGFRARLTRIFQTDLAPSARVQATDTRGTHARYTVSNLLDCDPTTYWATNDNVSQAAIQLEFPTPVTFNVLRLREYLPLGQRVEHFALDVDCSGTWKPWAEGMGIGNCRLARGQACTTQRVHLRIEGPVCIALSELSLFHDTAFTLVSKEQDTDELAVL